MAQTVSNAVSAPFFHFTGGSAASASAYTAIVGLTDGTFVAMSGNSLVTPPAGVLAQIRRDGLEARGEAWLAADEEAFKEPIRRQYETQGHPYYASARLWDDGVIDPLDTRDVLGLGLSVAANAPLGSRRKPVFRM